MNPFIQINPEHSGIYYSLFYVLAFLTGFVMLMAEGRKRNFPTVPWMLVIATAFLFFMAGCRPITMSAAEWSYILRLQPIPYLTARSVLGGVLFCIPGILLGKKLLRFKADMMDAFALVLPVGLLVQRFGCLIAGCCYGTPANLPWAIQYGKRSHAFVEQVRDGLITADAAISLPVHPVQFYEIVCCTVILLILSRLRKNIKAPGNLFLASVGLYGGVRFLIEFARASGGHSVGGGMALGLTYVQWALLVLIPLLLFVIRNREKKVRLPGTIVAHKNEFFRPAIYFLALNLLFLLVSRWLNPVEIISFNIVLLPMLAILVWHLFAWTTLPRLRLASLALPLVALLFMNQTLPERAKNDSTRISYNTFSIGTMGGSNSLAYSSSIPDCTGTNITTNKNYDHHYSATGFGLGRTIQVKPDESMSFGVDGFTGSHSANGSASRNSVLYSTVDLKLAYYGVRPYFQYDWKYLGLGIGFSVGEFGEIRSSYNETPINRLSIFPSLSVRGGSLDRFFGEVKIGNQFPTAFPALNYQAAMGFGFGKNDGSCFRIGTASYTSLFVAPTIVAGRHLIIEPSLGFGPGLQNSTLNFSKYYSGQGLIGSISLHYKFNKKEKKMSPI